MSWKFWKKDDDPLGDLKDLSGDFSAPKDDLGLPPASDPFTNQGQGPGQTSPQQSPAAQWTPEQHPPGMAFAPTDNQPAQAADNDKAVLMQELVLARLDNIKTQLDTINQRLTMLEQSSKGGEQQGRGPWYANR